ncbi:MAG: FAD-dependent oxidoreductase [Phycisphaerae bacterium]|nr:FAD-dependent oxidoreductase [Phycisphaerae bacterium]
MGRRIVIVGGVGAGASVATRARRLDEQAEITIFEKSGYVSFANCGLPYYVGGIIEDRDKLLVQTPDKLYARFRIDVRVRHEVTAIDRAAKRVRGTNLATGEPFEQPYDKLILCPGADAVVPPIAGTDATNVFVLRNMEDTDAIYEYLAKNTIRSAVIVGAGFIGLEVAEALVHRGVHVDVVELLNQVMAPLDADMAAVVAGHVREKGVGLHLGSGLESLETADGRVRAVVLQNGSRIEADMVLLSIGVRPNSRLAVEAGLAVGERGGIRVNEYLQTSDPDILAAGDAIEIVHGVNGQPTLIPLAGPANKHGRLAGEIAVTDVVRPAARVFGTAIVKVFDLAVASTGFSMKAAARCGLGAKHATIYRAQHASYYPGATPMRIKIVYDPADGRLLGAQIVGREGVDRRIDVVAAALHFGGTIHDLAELDLAYAPPYGSAKDPLNIAAFVAQNEQAGRVKQTDPADLERFVSQGYQLVDLRTAEEYAGGSIPGALHIPLDDLRARVDELPTDRPLLVFCQVGERGYVGARILHGLGRNDAVNLVGGYSWYKEQRP